MLEKSEDSMQLKQVQNALLKTLEEFDRVCHELGIDYVVYGGTAIGAVRHQGFIPWDDDADVCMLRKDYERFLREAPTVLKPEFAIENSRTHPNFPSMFSVLVLKDTYFIPEFIKLSSYRMHIGLDIFPFDRVAEKPSKYRRQCREAWVWGRLMYLQGTPRPYLELTPFLKVIVYSITTPAYWAMKLLRIRPNFLQERWETVARRFEDSSSGRFTDLTDLHPNRWIVRADDLYPAMRVPFDGIHLDIPHNYDEILSRGYGDYMTLPPQDGRKSHQPWLIDLGPYKDESPC